MLLVYFFSGTWLVTYGPMVVFSFFLIQGVEDRLVLELVYSLDFPLLHHHFFQIDLDFHTVSPSSFP